MKKVYLVLFIVFGFVNLVNSQVVDRFGSTFTGNPVSYTFTSTDVTYANATGGTFSTSGSNLCSGALRRTQVSTLILQLVSTSAGTIVVHGMSSGSSIRNLTTLETATTLNGTYTTITGWTAPSTINSSSVCGTINITGINIPIASFVRFTFSANVSISGFDITAACSNPVITGQPASPAAICSGNGSPTFTVAATGSNLTYKWQEWAGVSWNNITDGGIYSGSTGTTLTLTNPTNTLNGYKYRCNITSDGSCTVPTDGNATLTVNAAPFISSQSTATATYGQGFGSPSPLTVTATGTGLTYQWYSSTDAFTNTSGDDIALGTSFSETPSTAVIGTLYYYCVVSGTCPSPVTSAISGAINIVTACIAPTFSVQPTNNQSECVGGTLTLGTVVADQSPTYQWYSNATLSNVGGSSVGSGNGGSTATYTPPSITPGIYYYYCVATNGACPSPSNAVQITIDAVAITSQSTASALYALNGTANPITVTASGGGLTYQWYSSTDAVTNTSGDDIALGTNSSYTPITTVLGTLYYYCVVTGTCPPSVTSNISGAITIAQFQTGDYKSIASTNWGTNTTWQKWDGAAWVPTIAGDFPNSATASVYIQGGFTVNNETSARNIKNLYITGNSTLKSSNLVNSPVYLRVNGTTISVDPGSLIGNLSAGNNADGISLDVFSTNVTITGGGTINLSRIRTNTAATTIVIDNNVTLNYHGSTNAGNAAGYYTVAGSNNILTINAGKTLTFAPWSCYTPLSSSHTNSAFSQTINIDGTLAFVDGLVPGNATANGWTGHTNGYLSAGVTGATFTINIGSTGKLNVSEFYPNGTLSTNLPGTGDLISINVATGGELNISQIADFRKSTQTVTGAGTFNLASGATLRIGSPDGITSAPTMTGNIQTDIRSFNSGANYNYEGTAAQVTGNGLPATVNSISVNNLSNVTLTSPTASGTLSLTSGKLLLGANNITSNTISGATSTNYVITNGAGTLGLNIPATTGSYTFPIGSDATNYRPANINFTVAPTAGTLAARCIAGFPGNTGLPLTELAVLPSITDNISLVSDDYWEVSQVSGSGGTYDATFTGNGQANIFNFANTTLIKRTNALGNWAIEGTHIATTGSNTAPVVSRTGLTAFSQFAIGGPIGALPVSLISFNGSLQNGQVKLFWKTENEINVSQYMIEKSTDARTYNNIGNVAALNASSNNYNYTDATSLAGVAYYRLKIIDRDGSFKYSNIIALNNKKPGVLSIFPNPVNSSIFITHDKALAGAKIEVYAMDGRKVMGATATTGATQTSVNAASLPAGQYNLVFANGDNVQYIKFVKQ